MTHDYNEVLDFINLLLAEEDLFVVDRDRSSLTHRYINVTFRIINSNFMMRIIHDELIENYSFLFYDLSVPVYYRSVYHVIRINDKNYPCISFEQVLNNISGDVKKFLIYHLDMII